MFCRWIRPRPAHKSSTFRLESFDRPTGPEPPPLGFEPLEARVAPASYSTSTALVSSANPSAVGEPVTLSATVTAFDPFNGFVFPVPTGATVEFFDGNTSLGTDTTNSSGSASITVSTLSAGDHTLRATFPGGFVTTPFGIDQFFPSQDSLTQTVTAPVSPPPPASPPPPTSPPASPPPPPATPQDLSRLHAAGTDAGPVGTARMLNPDGSARFEVQPYGGGFTGGVRVAVADVTADGTPDLITAPGPGGAPRVRVFDGRDGTPVGEFLAYEPGFLGGVFVAAADVTGDGAAEIVTSPDQGGGPRVRVLSGPNGESVVADFLGIDDPNFRGGARLGVGDVNGDGVADLTVGAGFLGGPRVAVFDGTTLGSTRTRLVNDFFAFEETLRNGVFVAVGDLTGDVRGDLVFGAGPGGAPRVLTFDGAELIRGRMTPIGSFFAGPEGSREGVRVGLLPTATELLIAAVDIFTKAAAAYSATGAKVQDLPTAGGGGGFVGSVPYDVANYKYTPNPISPPPAPGSPSSGDISFNHGVAISNVKGIYTGDGFAEVTNFVPGATPDTQRRRITVTLDVQSLTPRTPNIDPAGSTPTQPSVYDVTGRLTLRAAGLGTIDVQVTGFYSLERFPDTFNNQQGQISVSNNVTGPGINAALVGDVQSGQITIESAPFQHYIALDNQWSPTSTTPLAGVVLTRS